MPPSRGRKGSSASNGGTVMRRITCCPRRIASGRLDSGRMEPAGSPPIAVGLIAVVVLVLANAFFVAAEFSLVSARRTRLDELVQAGDAKARLARRAVQSLGRYISATQLGITLTSLGLGWIGEPALAGLIGGAFKSLPGELAPKAVALVYPETVSSWLTPPLMGFAWIMKGPITVLYGSANRLLNVLG